MTVTLVTYALNIDEVQLNHDSRTGLLVPVVVVQVVCQILCGLCFHNKDQ